MSKAITLDNIPVIKELVQDEIEVNTSPAMVSITYAGLVAKVNGGALVPGQQYRITDYVTTTAQANTQSAGHAFDVIVTADGTDTLNQNARAVLHEGDTYFANSNLAAWRLKYDINNDTNIYAWADTANGKGVIYEMTDEYGNRAGYDFKNIQYKCMKITATTTDVSDLVGSYLGTYNALSADSSTSSLRPQPNYGEFTIDTNDYQWRYTFDQEGNEFSIGGSRCTDNFIGNLLSSNKWWLPVIVMEQNTRGVCRNNVFKGLNSNILTNTVFSGNLFEARATEILVGQSCQRNQFGGHVQRIYMGNNNTDNTFHNECSKIFMASDCSNNSFESTCEAIKLGSNCNYNIFEKYCCYNTFGRDCYYNTFGQECSYNSFGNSCENNTFGQECSNNVFGQACSYNTFGLSCGYNTFGQYYINNTIGQACADNTFGQNCSNNDIGLYSIALTLGDNCRNNVINTSHKTIPISASEPSITGDSTAMTLSATVTYTNSGTDTITIDVSYCFTTASGKLLSGTQTVTLPAGDTAVTFTENITEASDATGAKFVSSNVYKLGEADIIFRVMKS